MIGRGSLPCELLIIGEAPGKTENLTGIAFQGRAGKLLDKMLHEAGLASLSVYITNTVLCRPCDGWKEENREPLPDEVLACAENVVRILRRAQPKYVVLAGETAKRYFKKDFPDAVSIQHPAYILKTGAESSPRYLENIRKLQTIERRRKYEKISSR